MADWHRLDVADVRPQAARLLASDELRRAGQLRALLTFLVEERIAFGDRPVSQRRLAEEALGLPAGFSPTASAHVRIFLRRLRQRMAAYYAGAGASDRLVLGVTSGLYRLSVELRAAGSSPAGRDGVDGRPAISPRSPAAPRAAEPAALILTSEFSSGGIEGDLALLPTLVPRALTQYLLGKDGLVAIGPVRRDQLTDAPCESPVVLMSAADYFLDGTLDAGPRQADGKRELSVLVRLYDIDIGQHVWSRSFTETVKDRDAVSIAEMLAARLAATILAAAN